MSVDRQCDNLLTEERAAQKMVPIYSCSCPITLAVPATSVIRAARGDVRWGKRGDARGKIRRGGVLVRHRAPPGGSGHDRYTAHASASPGASLPCCYADAGCPMDTAAPARCRRWGGGRCDVEPIGPAPGERPAAPQARRPRTFRQTPPAIRPRPRPGIAAASSGGVRYYPGRALGRHGRFSPATVHIRARHRVARDRHCIGWFGPRLPTRGDPPVVDVSHRT